MPAVLRADSIAGADDALLQVAVATPGDLQRLLLALKRAGASRLTTMLRLQTIKPPAPLAIRSRPDGLTVAECAASFSQCSRLLALPAVARADFTVATAAAADAGVGLRGPARVEPVRPGDRGLSAAARRTRAPPGR